MAIEDVVQGSCAGASEPVSKEQELAGFEAGVDQGICNTDLRSSNNCSEHLQKLNSEMLKNTRGDESDDSTDESTSADEGQEPVRQLGPGLFGPSEQELEFETDDELAEEANGKVPALWPAEQAARSPECAEEAASGAGEEVEKETRFFREETLIIFDWDDTVLPSSWVKNHGLRLDDGSRVEAWQREELGQVARAAAQTLRAAKQLGTVVLITNAERGWIELSCNKFLPTLLPILEDIKLVSARTTYEGPEITSPVDWKVHAFKNEIDRFYARQTRLGAERRKNVLSLGDSIHEREALMRATAPMQDCRSKSVKFKEMPDIPEILKQHSLVASCFEQIVHHDANLDMCIRCT
eukprot:TRINITY_DN110714_c0_g1_i1.p1 TRINITY_DN110714_c0_g1~~TRINITY_DN110714_c0_g1_i1.p1  ORF type:complete len:353 (+),score=92.36 TRINITY_DN110714_c0_g1_i1:63-1121(+)